MIPRDRLGMTGAPAFPVMSARPEERQDSMSTVESDTARTEGKGPTADHIRAGSSQSVPEPRLSAADKRKLERLLGMSCGYVLDLTNQQFSDLVSDTTGCDISEEKYSNWGTSKAKRLRAFWSKESSQLVGALIRELLDYYRDMDSRGGDVQLLADCERIASKLLGDLITELGIAEGVPLATVNYATPEASTPAVNIGNWAEGGKAFAEALKAVNITTDTEDQVRASGTDEPTGPALSDNQSQVLRTMARFDGSQLLSAKMIAEEMNAAIRLSEETVRLCVRKLIKSKLAERPEGDRSGARLNNRGRKLAGKIAD